MKKILKTILTVLYIVLISTSCYAVGNIVSEAINDELTPSGMNVSVNFRSPVKVQSIMLVGDTTLSEDVTISIDSVNGTNYDTNIKLINFDSNQYYFWYPDGDVTLLKGDTLKFTSTYNDTDRTIYGVINAQEWR